MIRSLKFVLALLLGSFTLAHAADLAILRNGNSIRHERRQVVGAITRLYLTDSTSSYLEIPTDQIERFEIDTAPAPTLSSPTQLPEHHPSAAPTQNAAINNVPPPRAALVTTAPILDRAALGKVVAGAGEQNQIDPDFINSVIRAESGFNSRAVSKKGAQGLMQLMPQTASQLGVTNSFDPKANVEGGTRYLRALLEQYNYDVVKALAAYNAGPHRVEQYKGVPPYYETRAYVARIIRDFNRQKLAESRALRAKTSAAKLATAKNSTSQKPPAVQKKPAPPHAEERASR